MYRRSATAVCEGQHRPTLSVNTGLVSYHHLPLLTPGPNGACPVFHFISLVPSLASCASRRLQRNGHLSPSVLNLRSSLTLLRFLVSTTLSTMRTRILLPTLLAVPAVFAASASDWQSRSIYQVRVLSSKTEQLFTSRCSWSQIDSLRQMDRVRLAILPIGNTVVELGKALSTSSTTFKTWALTPSGSLLL